MKILELAPYAYLENKKSFHRNRSGLAYMVGDIVEVLSLYEEVYLLTQSYFTKKELYLKNLHICGKKWWDIFFNTKYKYFKNGLKAIKGMEVSRGYKLKIIFYFLTQGYVEKVIKNVKPDVVHIHTIGYYTLPFILACVNCKIPFIITLHGVISDLTLADIDAKQRNLEGQFCELASRCNIPVTVISSGVKQRLVHKFNIKEDTLTVILNGFKPCSKINQNDIYNLKTKLNISKNDKVFICVGSITKRKNQIQVVKAFSLMKKEVREKIKVIFIGEGPALEELKSEINKLDLQERVICCGNVLHSQMGVYYSLADFNITASKDEGFGLPIIEAMNFGIPTVTFGDLDAIKDLFDDAIMILAKERTDEALSIVMEEALKFKWDKSYIRSQSEKYTLDQMAYCYINIMKEIKSRRLEITNEDIYELL